MLTKLNGSNGNGGDAVIDKKIKDLQEEVSQLSNNVTSLAGDVAENTSDICDLQTCVRDGIFAGNIQAQVVEALDGVVTDKITSELGNGIDVYDNINSNFDGNFKDVNAANDVTANNGNVSLVAVNNKATTALACSEAAVCSASDAITCAGNVQANLDQHICDIADHVSTACLDAVDASIDNLDSDSANIQALASDEIRNDIIHNRAKLFDTAYFEPTVKDATSFYHIHLPTKFQGRAKFVGVDADGEQRFSVTFDTAFSNKVGNDREGTALVVHSGVTKWDLYQILRRKDRDQLSFITQSDVVRIYYEYDNLDKTDIPTYDIYTNLTDNTPDYTLYETVYTAEHSDQVVVLGNENTLNGGLTVFGTFYASAFEIPETEVANVRVKHQIYGGYDCDTGEFTTCGTLGGLIIYNCREFSSECNVSWINGCPRQIVRKDVCCEADGYGHECSNLIFEDVIHEDTEYNPDDSSDKLFDETSLAHYSGKTCTCQYPIVHLGDCTCVHGKVTTETDAEVCGKVVTCRICSEDNLTITTDCDFTNCVKGTHREYNDGDKYLINCGDITSNVCGSQTTVIACDSTERIDCTKTVYANDSIETLTGDKCVDACNISNHACEVISNNACCEFNINAPVTNISCTTNVDTLKVKCCVDGRLEVNGDVRAHGQLISEGDAVVHGDLLVDGSITTNCQKEIVSTGDYITLRENNNAPLTSCTYSGIAVNNYANNCMATITADYCGEWRLSDSSTVTSCTYTDISNYNTCWYSCLTQTAVTVEEGIHKNANFVELSDVALYNGDYYDHNGSEWYGPLSIVNGQFDLGSLITDAATITALDALTTYSLVYYNSLTIVKIDASTNQPILTREEASDLENNDILVWDSTNKKATNIGRPSVNGSLLQANIDSGTSCVTYSWIVAPTLDQIYPVGTVYQNATSNTDPGTLFGVGDWCPITDKFLMASGTTYTGCGGCDTVTLAVCHLPNHCHCGSVGSHNHCIVTNNNCCGTSATCTVCVDCTGEHQHWIADCQGPAGLNYSSTWVANGLEGTHLSGPRCTDCAGLHQHSVTGRTRCTAPSFTGGSLCSTDKGCSFSIIPPYCAVYTWYRNA